MWRQIIFMTMLCAFAFVPLNGCSSYRGAVYADYTQTGLGVRAAPETGTPASVNFGYDRGVMANVPKRDSGSLKGEAVSLISKNNVFTSISSNEGILGKRSEVTADAAFITGTAALVAVVPVGTTVHLVEKPSVSDGPVPSVQMKMGRAEKPTLALDVKGSPAARVAAAFKSTPRFVVPEQEILQDLFDEINTRPEAQQAAIFEKAASVLPQEFQNMYRTQKEKTPPLSSKNAFKAARFKYSISAQLNEEQRTKRENEIINALKLALESDQ